MTGSHMRPKSSPRSAASIVAKQSDAKDPNNLRTLASSGVPQAPKRRNPTGLETLRRLGLVLVACAALLTGLAQAAPAAYASAPNPTTPVPVSKTPPVPGIGGYVQRDPQWVAEKNAGKIHSGIQVNPATGSSKGTRATNTPYLVCCGGGGGYPSAYELSISNNPVASTWEPSGGCMPNYGAGSSSTDDYKDNHCLSNTAGGSGDQDFYNLCGPGAADIALWYWPNPPNLLSDTVTDTAPVRIASNGQPFTTYWSSERTRGYMTYLAWQIAWPSGGLSHAGMMDNSHYPSYATTLYGMVDALNWEESGRATLNGFYAIRWKNQTSQSTLLSDVETDIAGNNVPIVAEVDAGKLPNWSSAATGVYHFITIIGYDNTAGIYYYTDTCGNTTNCNWTGMGSDGQVHSMSQGAMWTAINAVTLNQSTAPYAGDGGYVW